MKILLINPPAENTIVGIGPKELEGSLDFLPPLGLMYVAGYLEKETSHEIEILDCPVEKISYEQLKEEIQKRNPDVVGITAMTFTLVDVVKAAKIVKEVNPEIKVILGGPHVVIFPEETINMPEIDFLVLGEGEKVVKPLLENINNPEELKKVRGLVFKYEDKVINNGWPDFIANLDELPFPARHLTSYKKYFSVLSSRSPVTTMFTSRGCPFRCLFCNRPHLGKVFRARSAKNVVDEMEECQKMGIQEIFIYDDTFTVNRQRVADICQEIIDRELDIHWDIRARVDTVDLELLRLMEKTGCQRIHFGVEAGTQKILNVLRKGITLEAAEKAFKLARETKIETLAYFMIGSPTETKEDIMETIKFAKKLNPDFVNFSITTPYPATDLYIMGLQNGIMLHDQWQEFAKNPSKDFKPMIWEENFKKDELEKLIKKAYFSFYIRPSYIFKTLKNIRSFKEFSRKTSAGWKLLKLGI